MTEYNPYSNERFLDNLESVAMVVVGAMAVAVVLIAPPVHHSVAELDGGGTRSFTMPNSDETPRLVAD